MLYLLNNSDHIQGSSGSSLPSAGNPSVARSLQSGEKLKIKTLIQIHYQIQSIKVVEQQKFFYRAFRHTPSLVHHMVHLFLEICDSFFLVFRKSPSFFMGETLGSQISTWNTYNRFVLVF